jgi:hypothetical protein
MSRRSMPAWRPSRPILTMARNSRSAVVARVAAYRMVISGDRCPRYRWTTWIGAPALKLLGSGLRTMLNGLA